MTRVVLYRDDFKENKKKYIDLCRMYLIKNKIETEEEVKEWTNNKLLMTAHIKHQEKLLKKKEPIKLNKKCKHFCEGWYTSDSRCACGEKKIGIRDINLEYLNFTILDSKPSGEVYCF